MDMNKQQAELLNTLQEVLRGVVMAAGALAPDRTAEMSAMLAAFADRPGADPTAARMLRDLAEGPGMVAAHRNPKH
jgi:hypothetical protein